MGMKNERIGKEGLFLSALSRGTPVEQRGGTVGGLLWLSWVVPLSQEPQCFPDLTQKRHCPPPPHFYHCPR